MKMTTCWKCNTEFGLPDSLHDAARRSSTISFWCPYGHSAHFPEGETEKDKLRRERDQLVQKIAEKDDDIQHQRDRAAAAERRWIAAKGVATRLKNRAAAGVCPCCNRSFVALQRHMQTKHPDFKTAEIIPLELTA